MKVIIDISKIEYDILKILNENGMGSSSARRILNGVPLTKIVESGIDKPKTIQEIQGRK